MYTEQGITLEEAAKNIGISKKSLDDYFLQLRNGHLNGFNFNEHKNDKIGILRSFNKQKQKQKKAASAANKDVPESGGAAWNREGGADQNAAEMDGIDIVSDQ